MRPAWCGQDRQACFMQSVVRGRSGLKFAACKDVVAGECPAITPRPERGRNTNIVKGVAEVSKDTPDRDNTRSTPKPSMPEPAADAVGQRVRASYGKLLDEPVPDRLLQLLDQLEKSSASPGQGCDGATDHSDDRKED